MSRTKKQNEENPADLVAILIAAKRTGNRWMAQAVRKRLKEQFGVQISFAREIEKEVAQCNA